MTAHAESVIARRKIPRHLLDQLMEEPQQVVPTFGRRRVYQSLLQFGGSKTYSLRTVIDDQTVPPTVVTVYRTSRSRRYWSTT